MRVLNWVDISEMPISEVEIQRKFPSPTFRVSRSVYRRNELRPQGSARQGLCFVVEGRCRCYFGAQQTDPVELAQGQYVEFPTGTYRIEPLDGRDAVVVKVWNLAALL